MSHFHMLAKKDTYERHSVNAYTAPHPSFVSNDNLCEPLDLTSPNPFPSKKRRKNGATTYSSMMHSINPTSPTSEAFNQGQLEPSRSDLQNSPEIEEAISPIILEALSRLTERLQYSPNSQNHFADAFRVFNSLTASRLDFNQFKSLLGDESDIIFTYSLLEATAASISHLASSEGIPWNFNEFCINRSANGYFQVFFSLLHDGKLPVSQEQVKTTMNNLFRQNGNKFDCINIDCAHENFKFESRNSGYKHLYEAYANFICTCGNTFKDRNLLNRHQYNHCRHNPKRKYKRGDENKDENDKENKDENKDEDDKENTEEKNDERTMFNQNEGDLVWIPLEGKLQEMEEFISTMVEAGLESAHKDGFLLNFEKVEDIMPQLKKDYKKMSFLAFLSTKVVSHEVGYSLKSDYIQPCNHYYQIFIDDETAFHIVEKSTNKPVLVGQLKQKVLKSFSKVDEDYHCIYKSCSCAGKFSSKTRNGIISHIETTNYSLVCSGCCSGFKALNALKRHRTAKCHILKIICARAKGTIESARTFFLDTELNSE